MIYFDNASTSWPKPPGVIKAVTGAMETASSLHRGTGTGAETSEDILFDLRTRTSAFFGAPGEESVVLTMNATHALNLVIKGMAKEGTRVVTSGFEHNAVMRPLYALREKGVVTEIVPSGLFENERFLENFKKAILKKTDLVILNCVSNVYGWILPFREAAELAYEKGIPVLLDASQAAGHIPVAFTRGVEFIAAAGHKGLFGPGGTGLLLSRGDHILPPLMEGGTGFDSRSEEMPSLLPERLEAGTVNIPGAAGLAAGIAFVCDRGLQNILAHERSLARRIGEELSAFPNVKCFSCRLPERQTGVISFLVKGEPPEKTALALAERGVAVRAGLHCAPGAHDHAGNPEGSVRLSFSPFNTMAEAEEFLVVMASLSSVRGNS